MLVAEVYVVEKTPYCCEAVISFGGVYNLDEIADLIKKKVDMQRRKDKLLLDSNYLGGRRFVMTYKGHSGPATLLRKAKEVIVYVGHQPKSVSPPEHMR